MNTSFQNIYGLPSDLDDWNFSTDGSKLTSQHSGFKQVYIPYQDNGGLSIAISGKDYVVLSGSTRQVKDYSIHSRYQPRVFNIGDGLVVSTCGFSGDSNEVIRVLRKRLMQYHYKHNRQLTVRSAARLIQTILYSRRFFPYYTYVMVVGMDEEGKGAIYTFDPVGSYERVSYQATGSSASLALPLLDSQVGGKNKYEIVDGRLQPCISTPLSLENAMKMIIDTYTSVVERHIQIGDKFQAFIVTANGIHIQEYPLKQD
ncbi:proteasome core particle subunit beta 6 [Pneumocystis jirovecii RU7]|uniref:Proteasome subunit beta n=1 Tax=Pneumocystis jirovecii (strain RU7) TaxID=1408657 RepID=A0A0W4ZGH9_PNEJ7|nr:proteasome core particle subunit beta 6 [Pneumocystis jirovecii RU7]KTW27474.1 hypothetical protein T551_02973 [Pneumocystis jirovecii RU7]